MSSAQVVSFGGGVQSTALVILNARWRVTPAAERIIFADPGDEEPWTYPHVERMREWLDGFGLTVEVLRGNAQGALLRDYTMSRSTVIPVFTATGGMGRRQCTSNWKIRRIEKAVPRPTVIQIGISTDEYWRAKDSRTKGITHRYPLLELGLSRDDCKAIIEMEDLPVPGKSRCTFCPFQSAASWRNRAANDPGSFNEAVELERVIDARAKAKGKGGAYLSAARKPLDRVFSTAQATFDSLEDDGCDSGFCFT